MEELQPQDIEDLLQELEEEGGAEEPLPSEVEALLRDLQPASSFMTRLRAARLLGGISRSSRRVVRTLLTVAGTDSVSEVRAMAAESLRAPVHEQCLQEHPDLMEATERAFQQRPLAHIGVVRQRGGLKQNESSFRSKTRQVAKSGTRQAWCWSQQ